MAVGASAGGLEALERLFDAMPASVPAAFVVIQHLSSDHKSMMVDLLARHTALGVRVATDGMPLRAGQIHLIPASHNLSIEGTALRLLDKPARGLNLPIDRFFADAARELGPRLVAVVLSGTGSDGARGARVVNEHGGLVLAQAPSSAKFDGMPRSVIATGMVDESLAPEDIAQRVVRFTAGRGPGGSGVAGDGPLGGEPLEEIIQELSAHTRIDFTAYKPGTLVRRIDRRVAARHVRDRAAYLQLLRSEPAEVDGLRRDVLIGVTSFLRDPGFFEVLQGLCLDAIIRAPRTPGEIRVWVAGCATGEEAYTLAILLDEGMRERGLRHNIKVFATDVNPGSLEVAQAGRYPRSALAELGEELAERHFDIDGDWISIKESVRRSIVFARHDLTSDPPFTRLDLVSCRNTLIYLKPRVQQQILRRFQYAIGVGGWLFLGSSESLGEAAPDFEVVDAKAKLFRCSRRVALPLELHGRRLRAGPEARLTARARRAGDIEAAHAVLMDRFVPVSALVDEERNLIHVFGDASGLLRVPAGAATSDITRMLPARVASVVVSVMLRVRKGTEDGPVVGETGLLGPSPALRVEGRVVPPGVGGAAHVLLSFAPIRAPAPGTPRAAVSHDMQGDVASRIRELEDDVQRTRENLQASIEELEAANEELQAANEELLASNEELQSTNEELQSVNEELYTVNAEHQEKIAILRKLNADLDVMARATGIPMLFLDAALAITRYTPAITEFVPLTAADLGRPLAHFTVRLEAPWLVEALGGVVSTGMPFQREVSTVPLLPDGGGTRRFLVKGLPYEASEEGGPGVVLTLLDITAVREARAWQSVIDGLTQHVAVLDEDGVITNVNQAWNDFARRNGDPHLRKTSVGSNYLTITEQSVEPTAGAALAGLRAVLAGERQSFRLEYPCHSPNQRRFFVMDAVRLGGPGGGLVVSHMETTSWRPVDGEPG